MTSTDGPQPAAAAAPVAFPALPVRPGGPDERARLEALRGWAGATARMEGCVGDARPGSVEIAHLLTGLAGVVLTWLPAAAPAGFLLLAIATISALARLGGYTILSRLPGRRPSWNVRVGQPGPGSRYVLAVAADRAAPVGIRREATLLGLSVALVVAVLAPWIGAWISGGAAAVVLVVTLLATRPAAEPASVADFPEARAVAAAVQSLARARDLGRTDVVGVVAGSAAEQATGVFGYLDWWAVDPRVATVLWIDGGAPPTPGRTGPVARLRRAGWKVAVVRIPEGDRDGMGVDREWLVG